MNRDALKALFVGRELLEYGLTIYHDSAEWAKTLRSNDKVATPATPAPVSDEALNPF
jgi:hypothetical protein